jgi:hypothetical protein
VPIPSAAAEFSLATRRRMLAMLLAARNAWSTVPPNNIVGGWAAIATQLTAQLAAVQIAAARDGADYVPAMLEQLGIGSEALGTVVPSALAIGSSGMDLATVLGSVPLRALHVASDYGPIDGLTAGGSLLDGIVMTQVADAARVSASVRTAASPRVGGYIRQCAPGACSRCLVLAGRWYRWSSGFERHPRCQCVNVPVGQSAGKGMVTDVDDAFRSMSRAAQDRTFTRAGAEAIRDGADINQVVNARRAGGVYVAGAGLKATTEGTTRSGLAGALLRGRARLMPEAIYALATDREDAIRLLRLYGYLR